LIAFPAVVEPVETPKCEDQESAYFQISLIAFPAVVEPVETPKCEDQESAYFQICIFSNLSDVDSVEVQRTETFIGIVITSFLPRCSAP
jgi:hypothetical protein